MKCKIKIIKGLEGVWPQYQPIVGAVYDADYSAREDHKAETAVIDINGKRIIVRKGEFEVVGL